jgi:hypothetical protein
VRTQQTKEIIKKKKNKASTRRIFVDFAEGWPQLTAAYSFDPTNASLART